MPAYSLLRVEDPTGLTDADWDEIDKLQRVYLSGGTDSLAEALDTLVTSDPERAARVLDALTPNEPTMVPQTDIGDDEMADVVLQLQTRSQR